MEPKRWIAIVSTALTVSCSSAHIKNDSNFPNGNGASTNQKSKQGSLWIKHNQVERYLESYVKDMRTYCAPQVPQMNYTMLDDRFQIFFTCVEESDLNSQVTSQ